MIERIDLIPLLDLQEIDDKIRRLEAAGSELAEEQALADAIAEHAELLPVFEERTAERARLEREQQRLEHEASTIRGKFAKEEQRLASGTVTSPREIMALQAELDALKRRLASLEDDELEAMEQGEAVDRTIASLRPSVDAAAQRITEATDARDGAAASIAAGLEAARAERQRAVPGIEASVLERYEKLRAAQSGTVVASFDGKTCGGCGLPLSPAAREDFKGSTDPWYPCENCRRVLVPR